VLLKGLAVSRTRRVVMHVVNRSSSSNANRQVEFRLDDDFAERLRQLRTLVPSPGTLSRYRDLVIDKLRMRLPNAIWRLGNDDDPAVEDSCMVISPKGSFNCGGRNRKMREELVTYGFPVQRLIELHVERPHGETFFIYDGVLANEQPSESPLGRWVTLMRELEALRISMPNGQARQDPLQH
jgi:hypothetical protein